ncbi:MAG: tetratricopeptide repeat protein [Cyclobacteriaceae bacterium]
MAKTKKSAPKSSGNELLENPEVLAEQLSRTEEFLEKNKNVVFGVGGLIAVIIAGYILFNYYTSAQNETAQREMFQAVYYFEADSLGKALNGDGNSYGFLEIIEEFPLTDAGNLANFYAGTTYLKLGDYESAIRYLQDFNSNDYLVQGRAYSLIGDAYAETDRLGEAITYYERAVDYYPNKEFTPIYLTKAAVTYEANGQLDEALRCYKQIVDEYPQSAEQRDAKKHKARIEGLL